MKKLRFKPRTLDDDFVREALCAVGTLDDVPNSKGLYFVVGGVATQSYLPSTCRRPTSDIDLALLKPLSMSDFRDFSKPVVQYLSDKGFSTQTKKGHQSFSLVFYKDYDKEEHDASMIEFARKSPNCFDRVKERLERERRNARKKIVEERDETYVVSSPEDIVIPKFVRDIGTLSRHPEFCKYIESSKPQALTDANIRTILANISELREDAIAHVGDTDLTDRLRFVSDIYDSRILSEVVGFNEDYLKRAMRDWRVFYGENPSRDLLLKYLLPEFETSVR